MQKLQVELKNIPRNTSLVPCSISSGLNKEETLSDQSKVLTCNNSEENLQQHRAGSNLRVLNIVYVLNKRSEPLMPTCQSRARRLVRNGKAKVVKRYPFTIQLTDATGEVKQEVILGVDVGYKHIGISALNNKQELFSAEILLRNNIVELLSEKRMYRRGRRNKHHWYRKPRFDNRNKPIGWLAPSIQHKADSHIKMVNKVQDLLPITKTIVETAKFDIQKINNSEISGTEYQDGVQKDFWNIREYVLHRDNHTCQHCKKTNLVLNVHHIESRKTGGNRPDNLITLCNKCHEKYHKGKIKLNVKIKNNFKPQTSMSIIRKYIISALSKDFLIEETFGYIAKSKRIENKMEKSHVNDAFVIANGSNQKRTKSYLIEQKRRNNRALQTNRKGFAPSIRRTRYKMRPSDIVKINGINYNVKGVFNKGNYIRVIDSKDTIFNFKYNLVESYFNRGTWIWN
jgi:N6-L-threonylcarbamoyladenine synthase